jgi:hypothetical protein
MKRVKLPWADLNYPFKIGVEEQCKRYCQQCDTTTDHLLTFNNATRKFELKCLSCDRKFTALAGNSVDSLILLSVLLKIRDDFIKELERVRREMLEKDAKKVTEQVSVERELTKEVGHE